MMRKHFIMITYFLSSFLTSCSTMTEAIPGVYKVDVDQGNIISQEVIDQLRPNMTKQQVQFVLGTPLLVDVFHQNRWDYVYSQQPGGDARTQSRISLFFRDDRLTGVQGDYRPSSLVAEETAKETIVDVPKRDIDKTLFQKIKGLFGADD